MDEVETIASATDRPIVLAMNDAIHEKERLAWFVGVARFCKLMFVADPPEFLPRVDCPVIQLHAPPSGATIRPLGWPKAPAEDAPDLVFLANTWYPQRL
ncbi:hypothetical protein LCGC14_2987020, partial [marine sediment metagenome]